MVPLAAFLLVGSSAAKWGILHVLRLLRDLLEQNVLRVPAGTRDRASLEGVGQICI